jgi:AraC-like DNA-binding protein
MAPRQPEVVCHESEAGAWTTVQLEPAPRFAGLVEGYTGWASATPGTALRRHLPGLRVPLIFMSEPGFEVNADDASEHVTVQRGFVAGLHDRFAVTRSERSDGGVQVDLTPLGARAILGLPMHELSGRALEAEEILGPPAARLAERLRDLATWEERFEAIDGFIDERLAQAPPADRAVGWAYGRIVRGGGIGRVGALATTLGWSQRRLVERFRDQVGLAPKTLARVVRFNRALEYATANPSETWAGVACEAGYYDQPHLVRDFVALSGSTPGDLAARTLPPGGGIEH